MATATESAVKQTYKDYCATPDDERYELLDGKLMMVPAPNRKHQGLVLELAAERTVVDGGATRTDNPGSVHVGLAEQPGARTRRTSLAGSASPH